MLHISQLIYYPIKSCKGTPIERAVITPRGIENDRVMMVTDIDGEFLTQRDLPRMALIAPEMRGDALTLRAPGMPIATTRIVKHAQRHRVIVWNDACEAVDQGDEAAEWLSAFLGLRARLARLADGHMRRVDATYARSETDETSFADGYPFLLASESSLDDLNARLDAPLPMNRFRPNIVVRGAAAFAEDGWRDIEVQSAGGVVRFGVVKPCARCAVTTTNQDTAERGKEPLQTLNAFRNVNGKAMFGQNMVFVSAGEIAVGDEVRVMR